MDTLWHVGLANAALAAGLALLAALAGLFGRRPALTHGLWLLVLLKLVTPPFWPVDVSGLRPVAQTPTDKPITAAVKSPTEVVPSEQADEPEPEAVTVTADPFPPPKEGFEPSAAASGEGRVPCFRGPSESYPEAEATTGRESMPPPHTRQTAFAAVWLTGTAAWFLFAGSRVLRFRRLLRFAAPAPTAVQAQVAEIAHKMGLSSPPGAWMVQGSVSPMLWAVLGKPRLVLPASLWDDRLTERQRAALLAHELAHFHRRDHWVRWLELLATGLYWWHPVVWWARREIGRAEEECCDAWVVWLLPDAARDYALALVETVDFLSEVRCPLPPAVSGIGHVDCLRRRLAMIMRGTCPRRLSGVSFLGLVGLGALVLPLLPGLGQSQAPGERLGDPPPRPGRPEDPTARRPEDRRPEDPRPGVPGRGRDVPDSPRREGQPGGSAPGVGPRSGTRTDGRIDPGGISPPRAGRVNAAVMDIEDARDEVELLEVQLEGKRAELHEAEVRFGLDSRQMQRLKELSDKGVVSTEVVAENERKVALAQAQIKQKQIQLKEAEVRLKQARRRLERLQAGAATGGRGGPAGMALPGGRGETREVPGGIRPPGRPPTGGEGERSPGGPLGPRGPGAGSGAGRVATPGDRPAGGEGGAGPGRPSPRREGREGGRGVEGTPAPGSRPAQPGNAPDRSDLERRLRELEKKLENLQPRGNDGTAREESARRRLLEAQRVKVIRLVEQQAASLEKTLHESIELLKVSEKMDRPNIMQLEKRLNSVAKEIEALRDNIKAALVPLPDPERTPSR